MDKLTSRWLPASLGVETGVSDARPALLNSEAPWGSTATGCRGLRASATACPKVRALRCERGSMLLEALVAVMIFSIGILSVVNLQAQSMRHVNDMQYRGEAVFLAESLVSKMWTDDLATLDPKYTTGSGFTAFREHVKRLPGADSSPNVPVITVAPGPSTTSRIVTVTVFWQLPGETEKHNYSTRAVIGTN